MSVAGDAVPDEGGGREGKNWSDPADRNIVSASASMARSRQSTCSSTFAEKALR